MELRQLRYFITVAREGTYGRASHTLNIAQPALSRQIKKLEDELGVSLFVRHSHGVSLTPAAKSLAPRAEQILDEVQALKRAFGSRKSQPSGCIKIGVSPGTAEILAFPLSQLAARRYPELRCEFISMLMPARADLLREGKMTLSVMNLPRLVDGLKIIPLMREPLCLIHHPQDSGSFGRELDISDLEGVPLVLGGPSDSGIRGIVEDAFAAEGVTLRVAAEANTAGACKALVRERVGPTVHVAAMARAELERGELSVVPIRSLYSVRIIAHSAACEFTPELQAMTSLVRECMSELVETGRWLRAEMVDATCGNSRPQRPGALVR